MFAYDIVLCGDDDETDMTTYLEIWRRALVDTDEGQHTKCPIYRVYI